MICPRYTTQEICVKNIEYDDNGNVIKETYVTQYGSLKCDENCSLYGFRPNCIKGD